MIFEMGAIQKVDCEANYFVICTKMVKLGPSEIDEYSKIEKNSRKAKILKNGEVLSINGYIGGGFKHVNLKIMCPDLETV